MKRIAFLIFLFCTTETYAQINHAFIVHLSGKELKQEHLSFLNKQTAAAPSDSLHFYLAKYRLQYNEPENFFPSFSLAKQLFLHDTAAFNYASIFFLRQSFAHASLFFGDDVFNSAGALNARSMKSVFIAANNPSTADISSIPHELQPKFLYYKKIYSKKPFTAGLLSALIPGMGKLYIGRKMSFANVLFTHVLFAASGIEAVRKLGWKHTYTICNLAFSGMFYLSNIYGSYADVKRIKKEKRRQFLFDAANYFELNSNSSLYSAR